MPAGRIRVGGRFRLALSKDVDYSEWYARHDGDVVTICEVCRLNKDYRVKCNDGTILIVGKGNLNAIDGY